MSINYCGFLRLQQAVTVRLAELAFMHHEPRLRSDEQDKKIPPQILVWSGSWIRSTNDQSPEAVCIFACGWLNTDEGCLRGAAKYVL
jgi:hypothetical protein